jgi:hypothetical protein
MPRCPAHCPPHNSGPLLPAAIIAGACAVAATWTVIVHVLTILVITFGVVAGLGSVGLAVAVVLRLRGLTRRPQAPARPLAALAEGPWAVRAAAGQRQITASRAQAAGHQQAREPGHSPTPAIEQHWHLHLHAAREEQLTRVFGQAPGRLPGAQEESRAARDGGHHDA